MGGLGHGVVYHGVLSRFRKQIAEGSKAISLAQARIYVDSPDGTDNIRGSPILGLIDIVHGAADAYICHSAAADCILGACPLIQEVGGRITDPDGELLPPSPDLKKKYSFVAAGNQALHKQVVEFLKGNYKHATQL